MSHIEKEKLIKADIASIENRVRHAFNQEYDLGYKEGKANCSEIPTGSTTKNDLGVDCISRAEMLKYQEYLHGKMSNEENHKLWEFIKELPPVTPQPKHGIWQQINKNEVNVIPEYRCSECGAEYKGFGFDFDYCPRCGCAMEEEE